MTLWIAIAVLLGACLWVMLRALRTRKSDRSPAATDADFYRTQLAEIERQLVLGQIAGEEAEAARAEAARRLIAATSQGQAAPGADIRTRRLAALVVLLGVPMVALPLYLRIGSPELPALPLAERLAIKPESTDLDLDVAIARIETHLSQQPDDGRGYEVIAPVYMRMGRFEDAVRSYRNALRLNGEKASLESDLGEALVALQGGFVSADARAAFDKSFALDPGLLKTRFYRAQAAEQDGDKAKALEIFQAMRQDARDAPLLARLDQDILRLGGSVPKDGEVIAALPQREQMQAIRGMVEGLDARLAAQGGTADEWAKLVRAYAVLKEEARAEDTLKRARKALAGDANGLSQFEQAVADLGIAAKPDK